MNLVELVEQVFEPQGLLSRSVVEFQPRPGQTEMAVAVARKIDQGGALVVEAGTGVGKTFSYLVPALLSGQKTLISTATKTLQDQLFSRDLPHLIQALCVPLQVALLKGRSSYLCLHRMELARQTGSIEDRFANQTLAKIETWAITTRSGDLAELPGLDERSSVIPLVTSSRENCLGSQCPKFKSCHVNLARREALAADVVVINHHLFFADLAVRESGMAELLPTVHTVVFDEAHQLNETGIQFLGHHFSTAHVLDFAQDLLRSGLTHARGLQDWHQLNAELIKAARDMRLSIDRSQGSNKLRWDKQIPEDVSEIAWSLALNTMAKILSDVSRAVATVSEIAPDFLRLMERLAAYELLLEQFSKPCNSGSVRWLEVAQHLKLVECPLEISTAIQSRLIAPASSGESKKSWIFTSATLGDDLALSWFTKPCGLESAEILKVESPFNYLKQGILYIPSEMVSPGESAHSEQVAALVARLAMKIGGRTLVLTTTLRAMRLIGLSLQNNDQIGQNMIVLVQGEMSKRQLIQRFMEGALLGGKGCILVGSASFWEGVDIPGDSLQMVCIDKLPFPPPNDPLVEARSKRLDESGKSAFTSYFLPEAAVALKQGAGRLIRRETDQGALVVCDTRLVKMGYGRRLISALPPMRRVTSEVELISELEKFTKTSTTGPILL